jgi:hypothetical protein
MLQLMKVELKEASTKQYTHALPEYVVNENSILINLNSHNQQMCMETIRTSVLNLLSEQVTNPHLVSHINEKMRYNRIKRND